MNTTENFGDHGVDERGGSTVHAQQIGRERTDWSRLA